MKKEQITRKEEIHKAATEYADDYGCFNCDIGDVHTAFIDGAKWADENISKEVSTKYNQDLIENASKLNWENVGVYGQDARYLNVCRAHKPLGDFLIREWYWPKDIKLYFIDKSTKGGFKNIEEAKKYANEMYKNEIKKLLEL